jgi:hypothetical protein
VDVSSPSILFPTAFTGIQPDSASPEAYTRNTTSFIMSSLLDKIRPSQSDSMAGVGADQSALEDKETKSHVKAYEEKYGKPSRDLAKNLETREESGRNMAGVGPDQFALEDRESETHVEAYEEKYGKPSEEFAKNLENREESGRSMAGKYYGGGFNTPDVEPCGSLF